MDSFIFAIPTNVGMGLVGKKKKGSLHNGGLRDGFSKFRTIKNMTHI